MICSGDSLWLETLFEYANFDLKTGDMALTMGFNSFCLINLFRCQMESGKVMHVLTMIVDTGMKTGHDSPDFSFSAVMNLGISGYVSGYSCFGVFNNSLGIACGDPEFCLSV